MEFDDSKIYPFNMNNFEEECFGSKVKFDYASANYFGLEQNVSKSAYMLVYDKVKKTQLKLQFNEQNMDQFEKVAGVIRGKQFTFEKEVLYTDFYNLEPFIPTQYKKSIGEDNIALVLENQIFFNNFTSFFTDILEASTLPLISVDMPEPYPQLSPQQMAFCDTLLDILPSYFYKVYCVTFQNFSIKKLVSYIETALIYRPQRTYQFFQENVYRKFYFIKDILENNNDYSVHMGLSQFLGFTLTLLIKHYDISLTQET